MNKTFIPRNTFLRVGDKFFAKFIYLDKRVPSITKSLYSLLFHFRDEGELDFSQEELADYCGCSVKTVQVGLKILVDLGYIAIRKVGTRNIYDLLLSDFIRSKVECLPPEQMAKYSRMNTKGEDFTPFPRTKGEDFTPFPLKEVKEEIQEKRNPIHPPQNHHVFPPDTAFSEGGISFSVHPQESSGQGHAKPSASGGRSWPELQHDFEQLWVSWPVHKNRKAAARIFFSLARKGVLPSIERLQEIVTRLKTEDAHWKRGFCKSLDNWLRDECWNDEPFIRDDKPADSPAPVFSASSDVSWSFETPAPISPETAAKVAEFIADPASKQTFIQERQREYDDYQRNTGHSRPPGARTGKNPILGLPGGDHEPQETGPQLRDDLPETERIPKNSYEPHTVLAVYQRQKTAPAGISGEAGRFQCNRNGVAGGFAFAPSLHTRKRQPVGA